MHHSTDSRPGALRPASGWTSTSWVWTNVDRQPAARSIIEHVQRRPGRSAKRWPLPLGEESVTLEDICEPYLMQMGMLTRTPRGRCVTRLAYEHLHMAVPRRFDEDDGQQSMF